MNPPGAGKKTKEEKQKKTKEVLFRKCIIVFIGFKKM